MEGLPLGTAEGKEVRVRVHELVTGRTAVIGQSGSGKSWTIGVVCEQLCKLNVGFCIVDPEGEYFSLKEKFQVLWAGRSPPADVDLERVDHDRLFRMAVESNIPVILDTSEALDERMAVSRLCGALYEVESKLRTPYLLVVEEAEKFAPQRGRPLQELLEISRRGRKRGLGLLLATQRPALVSKDLLSQCNNQILGKLTVEADLEAVSPFFASRRELLELPRLRPGEFFVMGSFVEHGHRVRILPRETTHGGTTPKLLPKPVGRLSDIIKKLGEVAPAFPAPEFPPAEGGPEEGPVLPTQVDREEVLERAEAGRRRRFLIFGEEERLVSLELVHHPLFYVEVAHPGGLLRRGWKVSSFLLDGEDGCLVDLRGGLRRARGFEDLLGLGESAARVLVELARTGEAGLPELEGRTGLSEPTVRKALQELERARRVTYRHVGRTKIYFPLGTVHLPDLGGRVRFSLPPGGRLSHPRRCRLTEEGLRKALKALEPEADLARFQVFYYPLYLARYSSGREVEIDGITGERVRG
ncbi:MAG: DUF87 domain-containing protein [Candidatus Hadarchaeales archaeon]